jgi:hypothetical protein
MEKKKLEGRINKTEGTDHPGKKTRTCDTKPSGKLTQTNNYSNPEGESLHHGIRNK